MNDYPMLRLGDIVKPVQDRIVDRTKWHFDKYIAGEHIDSGEVRIKKHGLIKGNEEVIGSAFHMRFKPGHVLYSTRRAYLRKAGIVNFEGVCSNVTLVLQANEEKLLQSLLPFILQSEDFVQFAISHSIGSTNPFVKWSDLSKYRIRIPPVNIQRKMSQMLWAIEDNIEKTENLVQISERLKKGLLEQLLTKGIGHEKFRKTELGEIPEEWEIKKISDVCDNLDNMRVPIAESERKKGIIPYYGATGIIDYVDGFIFDEELLLVGEDGADWSADAKTSFVIRGKTWVNNHAHVLRCTSVDSTFLKDYLNHQDLTAHVTGTTRGKLTKKELMNIKIPFPPIMEQKDISKRFEDVDKFMLTIGNNLKSLALLKRKLANLYLTGELHAPEEAMN